MPNLWHLQHSYFQELSPRLFYPVWRPMLTIALL
jgi:hypothetical protein